MVPPFIVILPVEKIYAEFDQLRSRVLAVLKLPTSTPPKSALLPVMVPPFITIVELPLIPSTVTAALFPELPSGVRVLLEISPPFIVNEAPSVTLTTATNWLDILLS